LKENVTCGHVASIGELRNAFTILDGIRENKRLRRRWKDNNKVNLKGVWCEYIDWIHLTQNKNPVAGCFERGN
jgi:hypothetical protein